MITGFTPGLPMRAGYLSQRGVSSSIFSVPSGAIGMFDFQNGRYVLANCEFQAGSLFVSSDASFSLANIVSGVGIPATTTIGPNIASKYMSLINGSGFCAVLNFYMNSGQTSVARVITTNSASQVLQAHGQIAPRINVSGQSLSLGVTLLRATERKMAINFYGSGSGMAASSSGSIAVELVNSTPKENDMLFISIFQGITRSIVFYPIVNSISLQVLGT